MDLSEHEIPIEYGQKLNELGVPVDRVFIAAVVLHPQTYAKICKWERDNQAQPVLWNSFTRAEMVAWFEERGT